MPCRRKIENYMSKNYVTLAITALIFLSSCSTGDGQKSRGENPVSQPAVTSQNAPRIPKDGNYTSRGKVTKVNMELVSVELDHEEIVGVMPPMIMEFYVREKSLLDGLKVGDNVEFVLEYKHPSEIIVGIKKIQ